MATVFLSLGSNIDAENNIRACLRALRYEFGEIGLSSVYESEAVGFDGENFLNLVVKIETILSVGELSQCLRNIEDANDRGRSGPKFSARTLDVDILTYDDLVGEHDGVVLPRQEITENAFVLLPLNELAPNETHPVLEKSYNELWSSYSKRQELWKIEFSE